MLTALCSPCNRRTINFYDDDDDDDDDEFHVNPGHGTRQCMQRTPRLSRRNGTVVSPKYIRYMRYISCSKTETNHLWCSDVRRWLSATHRRDCRAVNREMVANYYRRHLLQPVINLWPLQLARSVSFVMDYANRGRQIIGTHDATIREDFCFLLHHVCSVGFCRWKFL